MIEKFRHKGLAALFSSGSARGINPALAKRLRIRLSALDAATEIEQLNLPGYRLHELEGDRQGTWSISVNANWRLTFRFQDGNALNVDLEDYHS